MELKAIGEAFDINPKVSIAKGASVPFVSMDRLVPGQRDVTAGEERLFKNGTKFKHGDVLMARITPCLENKKIARYLSSFVDSRAAGSTEFIVMRGRKGISTTAFAYYYALSPEFHDLSVSLMTGTSGRQRVDINAFKKSKIWLPELTVQNGITDLLGSIDDKIAANSSVIDRADALREAIWTKITVRNGELIPLSSIADFINGKAFTKDASGTGRAVVRIAELNSGIGKNTVFNDVTTESRHIAYPGDLLFAWSGTLMVKRWPYREAIVNQHIFKVIPKLNFGHWALERIIDSQLDHFRTIASGKATTMGHIKRSDLDQLVLVPSRILEDEEKLGILLWDLAKQLEMENQILVKTRDELLPLLISGKITVHDAQDMISEVMLGRRKGEEDV